MNLQRASEKMKYNIIFAKKKKLLSQTMNISAFKTIYKSLSYDDKLEAIKFMATELSKEKTKYYLFKNSDIVVLKTANYQRLLEEMEELDDLCAYYEAKAEDDEAIPFEQAIAEIESNENKA